MPNEPEQASSEEKADDSRGNVVDGYLKGSDFNPYQYGPDEVFTKVYDCTSDRRIWLGDLPGVPTQEHLASCLPPGRYNLHIRAGEACPIEGKKRGDLIHPNFEIIIPGERTNAPANIASGMVAGGIVDSGAVAVPRGPASAPEAVPPSPAADSLLIDLVSRLVLDRPVQPPVGGLGISPELIDLLVKLKTLQNEPGQVSVSDIRAAFEEGERLGSAKGHALASAEHGNGSEGSDIIGVLGKVLEHPVIQQMIQAASAPAVSLDDLRAGTLPPTEVPSDGEGET